MPNYIDYEGFNVDSDYEYSPQDVENLISKIIPNLPHFFVGPIISSDVINMGDGPDASALIEASALGIAEKISQIASKDYVGKATIVFPNCQSGHWRLLIVKLSFPDIGGDAQEFFISDSLHEDPETIQAIFDNNIKPIFSCENLKDYHFQTEAVCKSLDLGLQSTGVEGFGEITHNSSCGPFMLRNLRILAEWGMEALENDDKKYAILRSLDMPIERDRKVLRDEIERLKESKNINTEELLRSDEGLARIAQTGTEMTLETIDAAAISFKATELQNEISAINNLLDEKITELQIKDQLVVECALELRLRDACKIATSDMEEFQGVENFAEFQALVREELIRKTAEDGNELLSEEALSESEIDRIIDEELAREDAKVAMLKPLAQAASLPPEQFQIPIRPRQPRPTNTFSRNRKRPEDTFADGIKSAVLETKDEILEQVGIKVEEAQANPLSGNAMGGAGSAYDPKAR